MEYDLPTTYTVICYSPPEGYVIKTGEKVKVKGWLYEQTGQILADKIINLATNDFACKCGDIPRSRGATERTFWGGRREVEIVGTVGKGEKLSLAIKFELLLPEE